MPLLNKCPPKKLDFSRNAPGIYSKKYGMQIKMSLPESLVSCYEWKLSQDLRKCKSTISTHNNEHGNEEKSAD